MAIQTLQPAHHISPRTVILALVAIALAVAAGFGVAALMLDNPATSTPSNVVVKKSGSGAQPGSDAYDGTNREVRQLMHRRG